MVTIEEFNEIMPKSISAENTVLGEIIYNTKMIPRAVNYPNEIFYNKKNKKIFEIIKKVYKKYGEDISDKNIISHLENNNDPDLVVKVRKELKEKILDGMLQQMNEGGLIALLDRLNELNNQRQSIKKMQHSIMAIKEWENDFNEIAEDTSSFLRWAVFQKDDSLSVRDGVEDLFADWWNQISYETGINALDEQPVYNKEGKVIGWWPGATMKPWQLIVLAARPAMGKTMTATWLLINQLKKGHKCWWFGFETSKREFTKRLTAPITDFNWSDLKNEKLEFTTQEEFQDKQARAWEVIEDRDLNIFTSNRKFTEFKSKIVNVCEDPDQKNPDFIFIDYLQLMDLDVAKWQGKVNQINEATRQLKELASDYNIVMFTLSQLSRAVENRPDKQPQLSDLRGSGGIEQDADMVLMLYRENYYDKDSANTNTTIFIKKHRNGATWEAEIWVLPQFMKIYNIEQDWNQYENSYSSDDEEFYDDNKNDDEDLDEIVDEVF